MKEQKIILTFASIGLISILIEIIFPIHYHPYYWWHAFIGFDYIFGMLGGFLLIYVSKIILFPLIKRTHDIYEKRSEEE